MRGSGWDVELRTAAVRHARDLVHQYDDLVPLPVLRRGFELQGQRISFSSFYKGIHRPRQMRGRAALSLLTRAPSPGGERPYDDHLDFHEGTILYHYRDAPIDHADNVALRAAYQEQVPLIYFFGVAPSQYLVVSPVFVVADDPGARVVLLQVGLPVADLGPTGPVSNLRVACAASQTVRCCVKAFRDSTVGPSSFPAGERIDPTRRASSAGSRNSRKAARREVAGRRSLNPTGPPLRQHLVGELEAAGKPHLAGSPADVGDQLLGPGGIEEVPGGVEGGIDPLPERLAFVEEKALEVEEAKGVVGGIEVAVQALGKVEVAGDGVLA